MDKGQTELANLAKFDSVFGFKLGHLLLFRAIDQLSRAMQGKDTTLQEAITYANLAKNHYTRLRTMQRQRSTHFTSHVSLFQRISLGNQCCHDTGESPPGLMTELLLTGLNVLRIAIEYNPISEACDKVKMHLESRFNQSKLRPDANLHWKS